MQYSGSKSLSNSRLDNAKKQSINPAQRMSKRRRKCLGVQKGSRYCNRRRCVLLNHNFCSSPSLTSHTQCILILRKLLQMSASAKSCRKRAVDIKRLWLQTRVPIGLGPVPSRPVRHLVKGPLYKRRGSPACGAAGPARRSGFTQPPPRAQALWLTFVPRLEE